MKKAEYIFGITVFVLAAVVLFSVQNHHRKMEDALRNEWKKDKAEADQQIKQKQAEILSIAERYNAISKKMKDDSIRYSDAYNALKIEKARLTKRLNEINLKNSTIQQLDSIRRALYGAAPLHSD